MTRSSPVASSTAEVSVSAQEDTSAVRTLNVDGILLTAGAISKLISHLPQEVSLDEGGAVLHLIVSCMGGLKLEKTAEAASCLQLDSSLRPPAP